MNPIVQGSYDLLAASVSVAVQGLGGALALLAATGALALLLRR